MVSNSIISGRFIMVPNTPNILKTGQKKTVSFSLLGYKASLKLWMHVLNTQYEYICYFVSNTQSFTWHHWQWLIDTYCQLCWHCFPLGWRADIAYFLVTGLTLLTVWLQDWHCLLLGYRSDIAYCLVTELTLLTAWLQDWHCLLYLVTGLTLLTP